MIPLENAHNPYPAVIRSPNRPSRNRRPRISAQTRPGGCGEE